MKYKNFIFLIVCTFLIGCVSNYYNYKSGNNLLRVSAEKDSIIVSIIEPYFKGIEKEMNKIICYNKQDLTKELGNNLLSRFVTDLTLELTIADLCIMNNGGLRSSLLKGPISKGNIFELMPFENELVIVELSEKEFIEMLEYIANQNGNIPFSGIQITVNQNRKIISHNPKIDFKSVKKIKVLTSDYLANGGDNMIFLQKKKQEKIGIKYRDAIINYCQNIDTLEYKLDNRFQIIYE